MLRNEAGMSFFAFASSQQLLWASVILISKGMCGIHRQQLLIHATLNVWDSSPVAINPCYAQCSQLPVILLTDPFMMLPNVSLDI